MQAGCGRWPFLTGWTCNNAHQMQTRCHICTVGLEKTRVRPSAGLRRQRDGENPVHQRRYDNIGKISQMQGYLWTIKQFSSTGYGGEKLIFTSFYAK